MPAEDFKKESKSEHLKEGIHSFEKKEKTKEVEVDSIEETIEKETGSIETLNNTEVIGDGPDFFKRLEEGIINANKSIDINVFSWSHDSTGQRLANVIVDAKKNRPNLEITIRVDKIGSFFVGSQELLKEVWPNIILEIAPKLSFTDYDLISHMQTLQNDPTKIYNLPTETQARIEEMAQRFVTEDLLLRVNPVLQTLKTTEGVNLQIENNTLSHMDHSKVYLFDKTVMYSGGMNVGDDYSGGYSKENWSGEVKHDYWKDYMVQLSGPASDIHRDLLFDKPKISDPENVSGSTGVRVLHNKGGVVESSHAEEKQITFATHHLLKNAKREILIEHAYIMDQRIIDLLKDAAGRNVHVKIIRSQPESAALETANEKFFSQLKDIPNIAIERSNRVLHAKLLTVDGKYTIVGSANLTRESMDFHEETALFFGTNARGIHEIFIKSAEPSADDNLNAILSLKE